MFGKILVKYQIIESFFKILHKMLENKKEGFNPFYFFTNASNKTTSIIVIGKHFFVSSFNLYNYNKKNFVMKFFLRFHINFYHNQHPIKMR